MWNILFGVYAHAWQDMFEWLTPALLFFFFVKSSLQKGYVDL